MHLNPRLPISCNEHATIRANSMNAATPHYVTCVEELFRRHHDEIRPDGTYRVDVRHDDDCAVWTGGICRCQCVVELVEVLDPERN
jgi:hypothetical protein